MKKYFVLKSPKYSTEGAYAVFCTDSLDDALDYASLMKRNTDDNYNYIVCGRIINLEK